MAQQASVLVSRQGHFISDLGKDCSVLCLPLSRAGLLRYFRVLHIASTVFRISYDHSLHLNVVHGLIS